MNEPRRFVELANLSAENFYQELSRGLEAIAIHVADLAAAAQRCEENRDATAARILELIAGEEAGKFLILLHAVRVPTRSQKQRGKQLRRANNHLAKNLYYELADLSPATMTEVERLLAYARQSHYVDYQQTDEGRIWNVPTLDPDDQWHVPVRVSGVYDTVAAMKASGFCSPEALEIIHDIWADHIPTNGNPDTSGNATTDTHWADIEARNIETLRVSSF